MDVDGLLAEQIAYYRARAPEYDDWWERRGRYDQGLEFSAWWRAEKERVARWLEELAPLGEVLEIAAGTGNLTTLIAPHSESVVALDSAPETLEVNAAKTAGLPVEFATGDVFEWHTDRRYDTVAFGFWLSHVPDARFERFWSRVGDWLAPAGRAVFVDNRLPDDGWPDRPRRQTDAVYDHSRGISRRTLSDGRRYDVVKVFREAGELEQRLHAIGWQASVQRTAGAFIYGEARPDR